MFFKTQRQDLILAQTEATTSLLTSEKKTKIFSWANLAAFFQEIGHAKALILTERETLVFSAVQWLVVALAYLLFLQCMDWIPPSVWETALDSVVMS